MNKKTLLVFVCVSSMVFGCAEREASSSDAGTSTEEASNVESVQAVIEQAEAAYAMAKEKQHAWTVTTRLLEAARKAQASGDESAAMVAANRALFTAEASIAQADSEEADWHSRVPQ